LHADRASTRGGKEKEEVEEKEVEEGKWKVISSRRRATERSRKIWHLRGFRWDEFRGEDE